MANRHSATEVEAAMNATGRAGQINEDKGARHSRASAPGHASVPGRTSVPARTNTLARAAAQAIIAIAVATPLAACAVNSSSNFFPETPSAKPG